MFWTKKSDPNPLGIPLGELEKVLAVTTFQVSLDGSALIARNERYTTRVEVCPPENRESEDAPIKAVVRVVTKFPEEISALLKGRGVQVTATLNSFASMGSVYTEKGILYIGSRLTIYEGEDAWDSLQLPLLMFATITSTEAILGGMRRSLTKEGPIGGKSDWSASDFSEVSKHLTSKYFCTSDETGLTAEFSLRDGSGSAVTGDQSTALFQLKSDQGHPELGGGLFCLLQMPHQAKDKEHLEEICLKLNNMEMAAHDLPPHFGAWCPGQRGFNPAYVSFFPNSVRVISGIALNASAWAMIRAQIADAMLLSLGLRP